ncbi:MAG: hypothetical protein V4480_01335 [Patescibacteria group bacterium]
MKQLAGLAVLLLIIGIAGFLYRNTLEAPTRGTNSQAMACTAEAKVCPDGSSVGRTGPSCAFAACPLPSVELPQIGIFFALPTGYAKNASASTSGDSLVASYEKSMMTEPKDAIVVRRYPIPAGKGANDVMLAETMYESSGMQPKNMDAFTPVIINGKTFQTIVAERFEGQVHSLYYLPRENDVLRFEVLEHNVADWTDAKLDTRSLPGHQALEAMLGTLQSN